MTQVGLVQYVHICWLRRRSLASIAVSRNTEGCGFVGIARKEFLAYGSGIFALEGPKNAKYSS